IPRSSKLLAISDGRVLLVRRKKDGAWALPGGKRKDRRESPADCLRRELNEELPGLRAGPTHVWRRLRGRNPYSGRKMHHTIFRTTTANGSLVVGTRTRSKVPHGSTRTNGG